MNIVEWIKRKLLGTEALTEEDSGPELPTDTESAKVKQTADKLELLQYDWDNLSRQEMRLRYQEMLKDAAVKAALLNKVLEVASLTLKVTPASEASVDKQAAEFVEWNLKERLRFGTRRLVFDCLKALQYGWSVGELVFEIETEDAQWRNKIVLSRVKSKDTNEWKVLCDAYRNVNKLVCSSTGKDRTFDPERFLVYTYLPEFEDPRGQSDLRAAWKAYWTKDTALKLRAIFLEKYSTPFILGTYPRSATGQRDELQALVAAISGRRWACVPEELKLQVIGMAAAGTSDFASALQDMNMEIFLSIQGAYLHQMEAKTTGARNMGEVHKGTHQLYIWFLSCELGDLFTESISKILTRLNFKGAVRQPKIAMEAPEAKDLLVESQIDEKLVAMGLPISKAEAYERYGRTAPEDPEDEIGGGKLKDLLGALVGGSPNEPTPGEGKLEEGVPAPSEKAGQPTA